MTTVNIKVNSELKEELNALVKSAILETEILLVNDKETNVFGMVIDEDVLPSVSFLKLGDYQKDFDVEVVGIKTKVLQKCLKESDLKSLVFTGSYLKTEFEDNAEILVPYSFVEKELDVVREMIEAMENSDAEVIGQVTSYQAFKHLMIPRINYKIGGYEVVALKGNGELAFGNHTHIVVVPNFLSGGRELSFHSSLLNKMASIKKVGILYQFEDNIIYKISSRLTFMGAVIDVEFTPYQEILSAEKNSIINFGDNLPPLLTGLDKLTIPLLLQDDKVISIKETSNKNFVKISVQDISNLESYVLVPAVVNKTEDTSVDYSVYFDSFTNIIKSSKSIVIKENESSVVCEVGTDDLKVYHILAKVIV